MFLAHAFSSTVSNVLGSIAGHPLDTVRVRMQVEVGQVSMLNICRETLRGEGIRGFSKGLLSPLCAVTPYNVFVFTVTEDLKIRMASTGWSEDRKSFAAGAAAASVATIIINPVELLKCRAQVTRSQDFTYRSAVSQLVEREGISALYKGFGALVLRDVPGWAVYFWAYEFLKQRTGFNKAYDRQRKSGEFNLWTTLLMMWCGGVAG